MPSQYAKWCRADPYDARLANLQKARRSPRYRPPLAWRSTEESELIVHLTYFWYTCVDPGRPSLRSWSRQLGCSHVWLLRLIRRFKTEPEFALSLRLAGDPSIRDFQVARQHSAELRERGLLRSLHFRQRLKRKNPK
jgi:hypothetical protein